jgi:hypothetical protein
MKNYVTGSYRARPSMVARKFGCVPRVKGHQLLRETTALRLIYDAREGILFEMDCDRLELAVKHAKLLLQGHNLRINDPGQPVLTINDSACMTAEDNMVLELNGFVQQGDSWSLITS